MDLLGDWLRLEFVEARLIAPLLHNDQKTTSKETNLKTLITLLILSVIALGKPTIRIITVPSEARVFEKDIFLGLTPLTISDSTMTLHSFDISLDGYADTTVTIVGSTAMFREDTISLKSLGAPELPQERAELTIETREENADIYIDDSLYGRKNASISGLENGEHILSITGFNVTPYKDTITLVEGEKLAMIIPLQKRKFQLAGVAHSRDFARFDFDNDTVVVAEKSFVLNSEEDRRGQRDLELLFGFSQDNNNSGFILTAHFPHEESFLTTSIDETDTLKMTTKTWGAGVFRDYMRTVAAIEDILRFDVGGAWGVMVKVRQSKYSSKNGSGGVGDFNMKNTGGDELFPVRGYASFGALRARLLAGYKYGFAHFSYQYQPSIEFDGIGGYPSDPVAYRGVHRLSVGVMGRF